MVFVFGSIFVTLKLFLPVISHSYIFKNHYSATLTHIILYSIYILFFSVQLIRNDTRSALSFADGIPEKAMAFPGANAEGLVNHLSRFDADHFHVALDDSAEE